ncbi:MAG: glycosyl transferase, partial [Spirochaetes bacterium]|nr:glycosyl transferase [Spirochaetota bacterium]
MQFPYRYGSNRIQAVVGVSEFILNKVLQYGYFSRTKIKQVIYNVRDGKNFRMQQRPFDGEVVFGFIGTIAPN